MRRLPPQKPISHLFQPLKRHICDHMTSRLDDCHGHSHGRFPKTLVLLATSTDDQEDSQQFRLFLVALFSCSLSIALKLQAEGRHAGSRMSHTCPVLSLSQTGEADDDSSCSQVASSSKVAVLVLRRGPPPRLFILVSYRAEHYRGQLTERLGIDCFRYCFWSCCWWFWKAAAAIVATVLLRSRQGHYNPWYLSSLSRRIQSRVAVCFQVMSCNGYSIG